MGKQVNLEIDGRKVQVPEGTMVVDAAKKAGVYIPVFCYHPKLEPVGMCRMCLVEIGRPVIDRNTGEFERNADGSLKINFGPKLETACTVPVSEGMVVRGFTENVKRARKDILEFLLTSHPLDCPVCDKGGECPLQNLTMDFGPGKSRFLYDEKKHLAKHTPLGELIYLDQERCIQCGRCVRFQDEIVDDPVIAFSQRGRALQIVTFSQPGFDSYFSGNTTDICPVGALTTADFRFQARPWELKAAASLCQHCPVGCNLTLNVRREHKSGGKIVVKRVMPRQNEWVNEIWICDKGRFAHHYAESRERITQPLLRRNGDLLPVSWEEAFDLAAERLKQAGDQMLVVGSGRLSNEDLFHLKKLADQQGSAPVLYSEMAGGDLVAKVGVGQGTNFSALGQGTAILVIASDLEEEAPVYWLRVKQAAERGAALIVANPRRTKLDRKASHVLRYPYGAEAALVLAMVNALSAKRPELPESIRGLARSEELEQVAQIFAQAENGLILFGSEGTSLASSRALAQACANLLIVTNHVGRANNGLIGVWQRANDQGAWDMGFRPVEDLGARLRASRAVYIAGCNLADDDPALAEALTSADFIIVQDLFLNATAKLADLILPAQSFVEREGSLTNGERRVQRYYPAVPELPGPLPDYAITAGIARRLGLSLEDRWANRVMDQIAAEVPDYHGVSYLRLAEVVPQWPIVGREDLYYGGATYENSQGLGVQLPPASQRGEAVPLGWLQPQVEYVTDNDQTLAVPVTRLYDRGDTMMPSHLLHERIGEPFVVLNPVTAERLKIEASTQVLINLSDLLSPARLEVDTDIPEGILLVPRSMGIPIHGPTSVVLSAAIPEPA